MKGIVVPASSSWKCHMTIFQWCLCRLVSQCRRQPSLVDVSPAWRLSPAWWRIWERREHIAVYLTSRFDFERPQSPFDFECVVSPNSSWRSNMFPQVPVENQSFCWYMWWSKGRIDYKLESTEWPRISRIHFRFKEQCIWKCIVP